MSKSCSLIGVPVQIGAGLSGCLMGPDAYRTAGLGETLQSLGHSVRDLGNLSARISEGPRHPNAAVHHLDETVAWAEALQAQAYDAAQSCDMPIFLGGDHSLAIGSVPGIARHWAEKERKTFVLWLDAHPDLHTLETTSSGNLHGTPMGYFTGQRGFEGFYPPLHTAVPAEQICMMGLRSVDPAERTLIESMLFHVHDMRAIDEDGIKAPLDTFLTRVANENGALHVSLDVDFLDPSIAPAVGTTVPGGATFREAHLIMEMLCDSGLVTSLDMVELNPFLDLRGQTARLMVDLCASLMGRTVLDRPTRSF